MSRGEFQLRKGLTQAVTRWALPMVILGIAFAVFSTRSLRTSRENEKRLQLVGPFEYQDTELKTVILAITTSARLPITVDICDDLAEERIRLSMHEALPLEDVLKSLGMQVGRPVTFYRGHHGELARPALRCASESGQYLEFLGGEPQRP